VLFKQNTRYSRRGSSCEFENTFNTKFTSTTPRNSKNFQMGTAGLLLVPSDVVATVLGSFLCLRACSNLVSSCKALRADRVAMFLCVCERAHNSNAITTQEFRALTTRATTGSSTAGCWFLLYAATHCRAARAYAGLGRCHSLAPICTTMCSPGTRVEEAYAPPCCQSITAGRLNPCSVALRGSVLRAFGRIVSNSAVHATTLEGRVVVFLTVGGGVYTATRSRGPTRVEADALTTGRAVALRGGGGSNRSLLATVLVAQDCGAGGENTQVLALSIGKWGDSRHSAGVRVVCIDVGPPAMHPNDTVLDVAVDGITIVVLTAKNVFEWRAAAQRSFLSAPLVGTSVVECGIDGSWHPTKLRGVPLRVFASGGCRFLLTKNALDDTPNQKFALDAPHTSTPHTSPSQILAARYFSVAKSCTMPKHSLYSWGRSLTKDSEGRYMRNGLGAPPSWGVGGVSTPHIKRVFAGDIYDVAVVPGATLVVLENGTTWASGSVGRRVVESSIFVPLEDSAF